MRIDGGGKIIMALKQAWKQAALQQEEQAALQEKEEAAAEVASASCTAGGGGGGGGVASAKLESRWRTPAARCIDAFHLHECIDGLLGIRVAEDTWAARYIEKRRG